MDTAEFKTSKMILGQQITLKQLTTTKKHIQLFWREIIQNMQQQEIFRNFDCD